jgi:hypothetical protein
LRGSEAVSSKELPRDDQVELDLLSFVVVDEYEPFSVEVESGRARKRSGIL